MPSFLPLHYAAVLLALDRHPGSTCGEVAACLNAEVGSRPLLAGGLYDEDNAVVGFRPWDAGDVAAKMRPLAGMGCVTRSARRPGARLVATYSITPAGLRYLKQHRGILDGVYPPDPDTASRWQVAVDLAAAMLWAGVWQRLFPPESRDETFLVDPLYCRALLARGAAAGFVPDADAPMRMLPGPGDRDTQEMLRRMAAAEANGWLESVGDGDYRLTDEGMAEVQRMLAGSAAEADNGAAGRTS